MKMHSEFESLRLFGARSPGPDFRGSMTSFNEVSYESALDRPYALVSSAEAVGKRLPLPFDRLMALSKAEGLRYPHPSSLRRTQKVKGRRRKVYPPRRAEGENCLKSFVFVSNLESCALSPAPFTYASFLGISFLSLRSAQSPPLRGGSPVSEALHLDVFHQPPRIRFFDSFAHAGEPVAVV